MTLREKQSLFVSLLADLIIFAREQGVEFTQGEGLVYETRRLRDGTQAKDGVHRVGSLHYIGLAHDMNLFVDGHYIESGDHPMWKTLGEKWESMHPLARWGGRFNDANHFSLEHEGRK